MKLSLLLILTIVFLVHGDLSLYAEVQKLTATHTYVMGDRDSKEDARALCYMAAKRKLLEKVGVLIESASEVRNLRLSNDQIKSYSAAILSVEAVKEEFSTIRGITSLTIVVQAGVDILEARKRLVQEIERRGAEKQSPEQMIDLSPLIGTMEVSFKAMQTSGIRDGCSLVYHVIGQDHAYRQGKLVGLTGNIAYWINRERNNAIFALKLGTVDIDPNSNAKREPPHFAYLQTSRGSTAKSKWMDYESDEAGYKVFAIQVDKNVAQVLSDMVDEPNISIGFNRTKDGLDVVMPLDLSVRETTISKDGTVNRHQSERMVLEFISCVGELTGQIQDRLNDTTKDSLGK